MFKELDEDGGGTLDCGEITALFAKNGIHMTVEQVATMFSEANRKVAETNYRKLIQSGMYNKSDPRSVQKKSLETNIKWAIDPEAWKIITKSGAALKSKFN